MAGLVSVLVLAAALLGPLLIRVLTGESSPPGLPEVLYVLLVGLLLNGFALIPLAVIQATGDARSAFLVYLAELVAYVPILALVVPQHGMLGAAVVWLGRNAVDVAALSILASRVVGRAAP